jgi:hypothetical protein
MKILTIIDYWVFDLLLYFRPYAALFTHAPFSGA